MTWRATLVWTAVCAACGGSSNPNPSPAEPRTQAGRLDVAQLEAKRRDGVGGLWRLADDGSAPVRALAVRGLGRIGGPQALERLKALASQSSREVWIEAVRGLAVAGAEFSAGFVAEQLARARTAREKSAAVFALGRLGSASHLDAVVAALGDESARVRQEAGIALGMYGRRQQRLNDRARQALLVRVGDLNRDVRYAAAYAVAREHEPPNDDKAIAALVALSADSDPEIRSVAIYGLVQRKAPESVTYLGHLEDADWRVAVQAVRGLTQVWTPARDREQLAAWLAKSWLSMSDEQRSGPRVHVIERGVSQLMPWAVDPAVQKAARAIYDAGGDIEIRCRAGALLAVAAPLDDLAECGRDQPGVLPPFEVSKLLLSVAQSRNDAAGKSLLASMLGHDDGRVRAWAVTVHPTIRGKLDAAVMVDALADSSLPVAGAAAELLAGADPGKPLAPEITAAALERARSETDAELRLTLLGALAKARVDGAEPLCRAALSDPNRTIRQSARECVKAATGADPGEGRPSAPPRPPPVDPADVIGKQVTWTVNTTRGSMTIELDPDAAPWHVAVLVSLTRKKFYDGLLWHRVVPDFVIQGGDPTGSGWGGPGFTVPAEPSSIPYERGTVGIADAGLDTGGCQWFVMHSRAPHLDARYTVVGAITRGQDVVDSIRVGDTIESATVSVQ